MKLTKKVAETSPAGEYRDTELKGFVLLVTRGGHRSFQLRYRLNGTKGTHTFGSFGAMTVEQARGIARLKLSAIQQGRDPSAEKAAARKAWTVKQLAAVYVAEHLTKVRAATRVNYQRYLELDILPAIGKLRVAEVTTTDVLRMFRAAEKRARTIKDGKVVRAGTTTANRVLATASGMFSEAIAQGLRTDNPCASVKRNPEQRRERYLDTTETAQLLAACDRSPYANAANLIRLLILTGARKGETLAAQWSEIQLDDLRWIKPSHNTKQGRMHDLPLSPAAVAALTGMAERSPGGSPWLFPGTNPSKHVVDPKRAVALIFKDAGLSADVTLHTLRHSFAARVVSAGHGLHAAGKLLGHTQAATTHRYAHLEHDAQRAALADVDASIAIAQAKLPQLPALAEVVSLATYKRAG